jgi:hypothetical protein
MLCDFFRINLPYGMRKNEKGDWSFFNREYVPLGWNSTSSEFGTEPFPELPIHTRYTGLTEANLYKLAWSEEGLRRGADSKITAVWFYNDRTNPMNNPKYWNDYFDKIKLLSKCEVKSSLTV